MVSQLAWHCVQKLNDLPLFLETPRAKTAGQEFFSLPNGAVANSSLMPIDVDYNKRSLFRLLFPASGFPGSQMNTRQQSAADSLCRSSSISGRERTDWNAIERAENEGMTDNTAWTKSQVERNQMDKKACHHR